MPFTYDPEKLGEPLHHLRFLVQDTTDAGHFFEDAEIGFIAGGEKNIYRAAATLCRAAALKVLQRAGLEEKEGLKYNPEQKAKEYREMAKSFAERADFADQSLEQSANSLPAAAALSLSSDSTPPAFSGRLHFLE